MTVLAGTLIIAATAPGRCLTLTDVSPELAKEIVAARDAGKCNIQFEGCFAGPKMRVIWPDQTILEFSKGRKSYLQIMAAEGYRLALVSRHCWEWRKH